MNVSEWDEICRRNRTTWLDHIARNPRAVLERYCCGLLYPSESRVAVEGGCPRCGVLVHESCEEFPFTTWEATSENRGGGPRVKCWFVREAEGDMWLAHAEILKSS